MIKIERLSDINQLSKINPLMRAYILNLIGNYCNAYECAEISEFGAFYIIESEEELSNYTSYGLISPLEQTMFEFSSLVTLKNNDTEITFLSVLVLTSTDYGVFVFFNAELLNDSLKEHLLSEYTREEIEINVSKRAVLN